MIYHSTKDFLSNYKTIILNLLLSLLLLYFIFHSISGNRGIIAYFKLHRQLEKTYNELEKARAERVEIEHKVKLLRPESLDIDTLDQYARKVLGLALPKEQVFMAPSNVENK